MNKKLKSNSEKKKIVGELQQFYKKRNIFRDLDEFNPHIIGFEDGVYDLQTKCFRKALSNELVYSSVGYKYQKAKEEYVEKLNQIIEDIYPVKEERNYAMTMFSQVLEGVLNLQEFYMLLGGGSNGKTIITSLIMLTMGKRDSANFGYCANLSFEIFKNSKCKLSVNEQSAQIASCHNARMIFVTECDDEDEITSALVKKMSGGDDVICKYLYRNPISFKMSGPLVFITNDQLKVKVKDVSISRRSNNST
jgi:putative DNA primase/helicase